MKEKWQRLCFVRVSLFRKAKVVILRFRLLAENSFARKDPSPVLLVSNHKISIYSKYTKLWFERSHKK